MGSASARVRDPNIHPTDVNQYPPFIYMSYMPFFSFSLHLLCSLNPTLVHWIMLLGPASATLSLSMHCTASPLLPPTRVSYSRSYQLLRRLRSALRLRVPVDLQHQSWHAAAYLCVDTRCPVAENPSPLARTARSAYQWPTTSFRIRCSAAGARCQCS